MKLGNKRADNILNNIATKNKLTLSEFLGSIGIEGLGKRRAQQIIDAGQGEFDSLYDWVSNKLKDKKVAEKVGVPNLGHIIQHSIYDNMELIDRLTNHIDIVNSMDVNTNITDTKSICITGKLNKPKTKYKDDIQNAGFIYSDKVNSDLNYLVCVDKQSNSSKTKKAKQLNIEIIDENELIELLEGV
jgi:DNA ligase (NAD+)